MIILGIETSCDETAAAIVELGPDGRGIIRSNMVLSQLDEHAAFGGVVPEIAARAHLDHLDHLIAAAMQEAGMEFSDLSGVAATCGPGLIGGLLVGMMSGKAIAAARGIPFVAVNHLEAHALTARLVDSVDFPYLVLLVSGGHTQILVAEGVGRYTRIGGTIDDAAGECFDKAAKMMGLPWPGGPHVELMAGLCPDPAAAQARFDLPRPMRHRPGFDFSFSGLKTAMRRHIDSLPPGAVQERDVCDLCSALQDAMCDVFEERTARALAHFMQVYKPATPSLVVCGGVSANQAVRTRLEALAVRNSARLLAPPLSLCGDNAAMIAWVGIERLRQGISDELNVPARPRWPLSAA